MQQELQNEEICKQISTKLGKSRDFNKILLNLETEYKLHLKKVYQTKYLKYSQMGKCQFQNCTVKNANFGLINGSKTHCKKHKSSDMIDLKHKNCQQKNCTKQPCFGLFQGKGLYCQQHKTPEMFDVISKRCQSENCTKQPFFGLIKGKGLYCQQHKTPEMFDVKNKRCQQENCTKIPAFGLIQGKGLYCSEHKKPEMFDVISKICLQENCFKNPVFGLVWGQRQYCFEHKSPEMVDVKSKRCQQENCQKIPVFGLISGQAQYCFKHKNPEMIDVISKRCLTPLCDTRVNNGNSYCSRCHYFMFPDDKKTRNYKSKELLVADFIKANFASEDCKIQFDKVIENGCSRRRPDILMDFGTHVLIVEVDEHGHRDYESSCETNRMCQLFQDNGYMNTVFIRFNPDSYTNEKEERISSCFQIERQTGKLVIKSTKQWQFRLQELKKIITKYSQQIPEKSMTIEYLFYNEIEQE